MVGIPSGRIVFLSDFNMRSEEHTSELQSQSNLVCRLLLEKKKTTLLQTSMGSLLFGAHLLPFYPVFVQHTHNKRLAPYLSSYVYSSQSDPPDCRQSQSA